MGVFKNAMQSMIDSIETSMNREFFSSKEESMQAHIYKSKLIRFPIKNCHNLDNFNPDRLQKTAEKAFPVENRPRGDADISSVEYYVSEIKQNKEIPPIWIIKKDGVCTLLDGVHRIVATYISKGDLGFIVANIIKV